MASDERVTQPCVVDDGTFGAHRLGIPRVHEIGAKVQDINIIARIQPESLAIIQDPRPSGKQYPPAS